MTFQFVFSEYVMVSECNRRGLSQTSKIAVTQGPSLKINAIYLKLFFHKAFLIEICRNILSFTTISVDSVFSSEIAMLYMSYVRFCSYPWYKSISKNNTFDFSRWISVIHFLNKIHILAMFNDFGLLFQIIATNAYKVLLKEFYRRVTTFLAITAE